MTTLRFSLLILVLATNVSAQSIREQMLVSTEWLQSNRLSVKVLEIGSRAAYDQGHIPGAIHVDGASLVVQIEGRPNELPSLEALEALFTSAGIGSSGRIVIYSRDPVQATRAWFTLDHLGAGHRAAILDGGIAKWIAEQRSLSTEPVTPHPQPFHATAHPESVTTLGAMRNAIRLRDALGSCLALIDARPQDQFSAGSIPGAVNLPWSENFTAGEFAVFRSPDELRALYADAGVTPESCNVTYCRSGMTATVSYFVLKYLGYDASLYDGSYAEWSQQAKR